ncbi:MAG: hypothetical protein NZ561_13260 [Phycisphaerae bacterium]|nr:hypothetical protein [Phycisphaerae bacterium]MDW8261396.1 hypothetical protein [Phycisphaerales bacterium]
MNQANPLTTKWRDRWWIALVLVALGLTLRLYWFPHRYEQRTVDEAPYLYTCLMLAEGMMPGHKAVPAGLQTWLGWLWINGQAALNLLNPTDQERSIGLVARPVYVLNRTLFDIARDVSDLRIFLLSCNVLFDLIAIVAAWKFGQWAGGSVGGLIAGGFLATGWVFHDVGASVRPLSMSFGMAMMAFLLVSRRRYGLAAVALGLAIGSRIEMVLLIPLLVALVICELGWKSGLRQTLICAGIAAVSFLVIAPWWLMSWFGNLRSVIGARFLGAMKPVTFGDLMTEMFWFNALVVPCALLAWSWVLAVRRPRGWLVPAAATLILLSVIAGNAKLSYHTPAILAVLLTAAIGAGALPAAGLKLAAVATVVSLVVAAGHSIRFRHAERQAYAPDEALAWIEAHVPPGTRLYWPGGVYKLPLPTDSAAAAMWSEVVDEPSWRKKMEWAVGFVPGTDAQALPRATSEDIMAKERCYVRPWYILGGRPEVPIPRFDVRRYGDSITFGVWDPIPEFRNGRCVIVVKGKRVDEQLGKPAAEWTSPRGWGTFVYVAPDVPLLK